VLLGSIVAAQYKRGTMGVEIRMLIPGVLFYLGVAFWFIWLGIGSIRARRWARSLWLAASWLWLIAGIGGVMFMLTTMPGMYGQMSKSGQLPAGAIRVAQCVSLGFMALFYIVFPGAFILFYGSRHVKATVERLDPRPRWTDKCPLPVLAVSLVLASIAGSLLLLGFYNWALPFFGVILTGATSAALVFILSAVLLHTAWRIYRLHVAAWRIAIALTGLWGCSILLTFTRTSFMTFYEKMNFPAAQLDVMRAIAPAFESGIMLFSWLWVLIALGYLLYIRKFFAPAPRINSSPGPRTRA
jgi:hypothetical protein